MLTFAGLLPFRAEDANSERRWRPKFSETGLTWGVASLEQSVAGAWFKALPTTSILSAEVDRDARWCLQQLIALRPETYHESPKEIVLSACDGVLHASGYGISDDSNLTSITVELTRQASPESSAPAESTSFAYTRTSHPAEEIELTSALRVAARNENVSHPCTSEHELQNAPAMGGGDDSPCAAGVATSMQHLRVIGRTPLTRAPPEVILYVPGYNASLKDEVCAIGQLLCLGDFPPTVKAMTFSWPGGRELTYFTAIDYARHPRCQSDFAAFVASLVDAGVREFHVLCHSAGAHVFFSALHLLTPMLATCNQQQRSAGGGSAISHVDGPHARLATVMMMSPDYPLRTFVAKDFSMLRR